MDDVDGLHPAAAASGPERAARVRALFSGIARRYDVVNRVVSLGRDRSWRREVVRALGLRPGSWCLDACCGTGDLGLELARVGVRVIGVDFCRPMLSRARGKAGEAPLGLVEGDSLRLPIRSASLDGACVAFGLRNLADPARGLSEMARVVKPGGRVAVLEFSRPRGRVLGAIHAFHVGRVLPVVGDILSGSPGTYKYLPETIGSWFDTGELAGLMRDAGLADVSVDRLTFGAVALHVGTRRATP